MREQTPTQRVESLLKTGGYDEAVQIAMLHNLNLEPVYREKWLHEESLDEGLRVETIRAGFAHIEDVDWLLT
eukprot:5110989-Prorocentrum_lima.AAC.1